MENIRLGKKKIVLNNKIIEEIQNFNYLDCQISHNWENDLKDKVYKFQSICGIIKRILQNKVGKVTKLKFYKVMTVTMLTDGAEN